jgi:hypothetical protein
MRQARLPEPAGSPKNLQSLDELYEMDKLHSAFSVSELLFFRLLVRKRLEREALDKKVSFSGLQYLA